MVIRNLVLTAGGLVAGIILSLGIGAATPDHSVSPVIKGTPIPVIVLTPTPGAGPSAAMPGDVLCPKGWTLLAASTGLDEVGRAFIACDYKDKIAGESWNLTIRSDRSRIAIRYTGGAILTYQDPGDTDAIDSLLQRLH